MQPPDGPDRIVTIPNALSVLRLLGVPVFLWLLLGPEADIAAGVVLAVSGFTDWLDGKLARLLDQSSRLGAMLDPAVDRLYTLVTLLAFAARDLLPWWVVIALISRDVLVGAGLPLLRARGFGPPEVHYLGKAATFNLLYAFPMLLLADNLDGTDEAIVRPLAYGFVIWGGALYLWSGFLYLVQIASALRLGSPDPAGSQADVMTPGSPSAPSEERPWFPTT